MRKIVTMLAALTTIAATTTAAHADPNPGGTGLLQVTGGTADTALTQAWQDFGRQPRVGWAAADGTYSTRLPSGQVAWLFNDTFFGPTNADDSLPSTAKFTHNSAVLADHSGRQPLATVTAGRYGKPQSLVGPTPSDPMHFNNHWYWNGDGIVDGDGLQVFEFEQQPTDGPPPFNFQWTGTEIATLNPYTLQLEHETKVPTDGNIQWGVELFQHQGYTFVYGVEGGFLNNYVHLARAKKGHLADGAWEYWTGHGWSSDRTASSRILDNVGSSFGVTRVGHTYVLSTFDYGLNSTIYTYTSSSPTGPFTNKTKVYETPEVAQGMYTYNVAAHPEISKPGELVISYNTNDEKLAGLYADIDRNRPRFVDVHLAPSAG